MSGSVTLRVSTITKVLSIAQKEGIWAWDGETEEPVLIFPVILALLGDNPMHSEFACHVGLRGRFFCRTCSVWRGGFMRGPGEADPDEDYNAQEDLALDTDANVASPGPPNATQFPSPGDQPPAREQPQTIAERTLLHIRRRLTAFIRVSFILIPSVDTNRSVPASLSSQESPEIP